MESCSLADDVMGLYVDFYLLIWMKYEILVLKTVHESNYIVLGLGRMCRMCADGFFYLIRRSSRSCWS